MRVIVDGDVLAYQALPRDMHSAFPLALETYAHLKKQMLENNFGTKLEIYLNEPGSNFRKTLYDTYKENRKNKEKPKYLFDLMHHMDKEDPDVIVKGGGETDDHCLEACADASNNGEPFVLCSVDKDLRTIPSTYYNMRTREHSRVTAEESMEFILKQAIMGDPGDDIQGIRGVGKVKAQKYLDQYDTFEEKYYGVKEIWKDHCGSEEEAIAGYQDTFNLTFIRRRNSDLRTLDFWGMDYASFCQLLRFHVPDRP